MTGARGPQNGPSRAEYGPRVTEGHQSAATRLQEALRTKGIIVEQPQLASEIAQLGESILQRESRRGIFSGPIDRLAAGVIAMADNHQAPIRSSIGHMLIEWGLGYEADEVAMKAAKGGIPAENPAIATVLAITEIAPEIGAVILASVASIVPVAGTLAGYATGEAGDVAVGTVIAGIQFESYAPVPDITDPSGKGEVHHKGARAIPILTGPEPYLNTTLTLAFMRAFGRALIRQLKDRPSYQSMIEKAMTRAAAIQVGTEIIAQTEKTRR